MYLIISALRQYSRAEQSIRAGNWKRGLKPAHDVTEKTLAVLGLGGIGLRLAELCHAFPMRIIYHSRHPNLNAPAWCEYFPEDRLDAFYGQADVLSVHVPLRKETEGLVGEREIRKLKRGAVLVNTARGKVIDEAAMIRALEDGHVSRYSLSHFVRSVRSLTYIILTPFLIFHEFCDFRLTVIPPSAFGCRSRRVSGRA